MRSKKRLNFFDRLVLWFNVLLCLLLLLSYLAPVTNPGKMWPIAFLGLAYPPLIVLALITIFYWIIRGSWYCLLSLITILVGWNVLVNHVGFRSSVYKTARPDSSSIRMMTYNVHNFKRYGAENDISTKHEILELISAQQPDIINFQEFFTRRRGQYDMRDSIIKLLNSPHYYFEKFRFNDNEGIGMAIFSRYPIINHGLIHLSDEMGSGNQCLYIDIKRNNSVFRVYNVHLQSIRFDPEDYQYVDSVSRIGKPSMTQSKRIAWKLKKAFIKRSEQVIKVKNHSHDCSYPFIIAGDFNDTPSSFAVNQMAKGLKNAFREKGSGIGRTYNGDFPNYQIDYIMASPQFDIRSYKILEKRLSDHYPVCSDLLLK